MAASVHISLPRSYSPQFPDRCVVCEKGGPRSHVRLITGTLGWWTWLLWWWGSPFIAKAPACNRCVWKLHGLRFLSFAVTVAIVLAAFWLIWPYLEGYVPRGLRKWAMLGVAIACVFPQVVFEMFFAKPFDITAFSTSVDYEFTSKDYALEFMTLNMDAPWIKINGERFET